MFSVSNFFALVICLQDSSTWWHGLVLNFYYQVNTPFYILFFLSLVDRHLFCLLWMVGLWVLIHKMFPTLFGTYLGVRLLDGAQSLCLTFWNLPASVPSSSLYYNQQQETVLISIFSPICYCVFIVDTFMDVNDYFIRVLSCIFTMANRAGLLSCLLDTV